MCLILLNLYLLVNFVMCLIVLFKCVKIYLLVMDFLFDKLSFLNVMLFMFINVK